MTKAQIKAGPTRTKVTKAQIKAGPTKTKVTKAQIKAGPTRTKVTKAQIKAGPTKTKVTKALGTVVRPHLLGNQVSEFIALLYSFVFQSLVGISPQLKSKSGHYRPASDTQFEWRFAGGPMVARLYILTGI